LKALKKADAHMLEELTKAALSLCRAHSAGISVEEQDHGRKVFRWCAAAGSWMPYLRGTMPREGSPSGIVLDRRTPQLMAYPERHFDNLPADLPPLVETLLVPFDVDGVTVGTVWATVHDDSRRFDREDLRLLQSLSECASVIYEMRQRTVQVQDALARARDGSQLLQTISAGLIRENDVNALYEQFLDAAVGIMRSESASMQMLAGNALSLITWRGFHPDSARFWQTVHLDSATPCGRMLRTGKRYVITDTEKDDVLAGTADLDEFRRSGIRAVQSTPLRSRSGELLGALSTLWGAPHEPTVAEFQLFDVLARLAADLIERAKTDQALRESDHRKNEFLAILGHELKNPLTPLLAGLEVLKQPDTSPAPVEEIHSMMSRQVSHLTGLVNDLLDLSRVTRGMVELHCSPLDLRVAIEAALEQTKPLIEERQHALVVEQFKRRLPVEGDSKRLTQVIANVLGNAAKYTDRGGKIHLIARSENDQAVVRILDSGIGIPAGQLDKVFEMFTQVPEHHARSGGGGLGIGLAISRRLIELHGGSITVRSEGLGRGSEFLIRLPLGASVVRSASSLRQGSRAAQRPQRVLIIEDNVDVAKALRVLVTSIGHVVQTAHDGPSGIALLETFTPDVLLLDIGLPGMSGYEVARRVRSMPGGKKIRIVAVTGWGQESDREHARQAGCDHHLTKPVRREELERAMRGAPRGTAPGAVRASARRRA
jgi:signal transduction histidine kinase/ActR/RegA family two-component response regulator